MPKRSKSRRKGRSKSRRKSRRNKKSRGKGKIKGPRNVAEGVAPAVGQDVEEQEGEGAESEGQGQVPAQVQTKTKYPKAKKGKSKQKSKGKSKSKSKSKGKKGKSKGGKGKSPKGKKKKGTVIVAPPEEEEEAEFEEEEEYGGEASDEYEFETVFSLPTSAGRESEGSSYSRSSEGSDLCVSGEYETDSSELKSTPSSMTLVVPESRSTDACAALEEMEAEVVTKAAIRKCHGIEADEDEEDAEKSDDAEEQSHQKEAPDFNYVTTYEEYLDHFVTSKDLYYFESDDVARTITTLGFRVPELLTREQFAEVMQEIQAKRFAKRKDDIHVAYGIPAADITCPLMQALAEREKQNRTGNMACLIYIRMLNKKNQEVSAWIDFKLRLVKDGTELWTDYFRGKRRLIPRNSDLCYYNWTTFQVRYNSSDNYLVTTDIVEGLQFLNKLDRKLITVNPRVKPGDNTEIVKIKSPNYFDAVIYDHFLRVKA